MKARNNIIVAVILFLAPCIAGAEEMDASFPKDLIYRNKPIDSLCIYEAANSVTAVPLNKCGIHSQPGRKVIRPDNDLMNNGFVGYEYIHTHDLNQNQLPHSYSYYKVLGKPDDQYVVSAFNNLEERQEMTSLFLVKREKDNIYVTHLISGERCNGGISDLQLLGQRLVFTVDISPYDFLRMTNLNPHHLQPHTDLESCSSCCIGKANYLMDFRKGEAKLRLLSVDLGKKNPEIIANGRYQACFNKLVTDSQKQWLRYLDPKKLKKFVKKFNSECITAELKTTKAKRTARKAKKSTRVLSVNTFHHQHATITYDV